MTSRLVLCLSLALPMVAQQGPSNLAFSESDEGGAPSGWVWRPSLDHALSTIENCPESGSRCLAIRSMDRPDAEKQAYILQTFDATPFRGKNVRFAASLLLEAPTLSGAELFLRADTARGSGLQVYSIDQPIRIREWTTRQIVGEIDGDAKSLTIGVRFSGLGSVLFASPAFELLDD